MFFIAILGAFVLRSLLLWSLGLVTFYLLDSPGAVGWMVNLRLIAGPLVPLAFLGVAIQRRLGQARIADLAARVGAADQAGFGPHGLQVEPMEVSYFTSREKIVPVKGGPGMAIWRDRIFGAMSRNAGNVTDYFNIPNNRVVELGSRVEI